MSRPCRAREIWPGAWSPWAHAQGFYLGHPFGARTHIKLQPNRVRYLRSFESRGASGARHSTTATGTNVTDYFHSSKG